MNYLIPISWHFTFAHKIVLSHETAQNEEGNPGAHVNIKNILTCCNYSLCVCSSCRHNGLDYRDYCDFLTLAGLTGPTEPKDRALLYHNRSFTLGQSGLYGRFEGLWNRISLYFSWAWEHQGVGYWITGQYAPVKSKAVIHHDLNAGGPMSYIFLVNE